MNIQKNGRSELEVGRKLRLLRRMAAAKIGRYITKTGAVSWNIPIREWFPLLL